MRSLILRIAAVLFAICGSVVTIVLLLCEEGWQKLAVIPMIYLIWRFGVYAIGGEKARENDKMSAQEVLAVLLGGFGLVVVSCVCELWFSRSVSVLMHAFVVLVYAIVFFVVQWLKRRLARELSSIDKATQDKVLSVLNPSDRSDILRRMWDSGHNKSHS